MSAARFSDVGPSVLVIGLVDLVLRSLHQELGLKQSAWPAVNAVPRRFSDKKLPMYNVSRDKLSSQCDALLQGSQCLWKRQDHSVLRALLGARLLSRRLQELAVAS